MTSPHPVPTARVPTGPTFSSASPEADLRMDLTAIWTIGKTRIPEYVEELADALDKITKALDSVQLNWAGESQKEAQDINDRWQACAKALFGTKQHPEIGVLNRIAGGLQGVALNMSATESLLVDMWQKYINVMNQLLAGQDPGGSGGGGAASAPISEV
jgi:hypothetical protein